MKALSISLLLLTLFSFSVPAQSNWYAQNSGVNRELTGVYFVDENNGWICGWTGTILHTTDGGQTWNQQNCPPTNAYYSVHFTDLQNGWAVGYYGRIAHTSDGGQTWEIQSSPTTSDLYSIYFINSNEGWAAGGDYGSFPSYITHRVILHTTNGGISWLSQYSQSYKSVLKSICFVNSDIGYATGDSGVLMRTTDAGTDWSEGFISGGDFRDIFFVNGSTGFASGSAVYKTLDGGNNWNSVLSVGNVTFDGISFPDEQNGWLVGVNGSNNAGVIYHSSDGGENWVQQNTPAFEGLFSVFFVNNNSGWAVGHLGTVAATDNPTPVELTSFTAVMSDNDIILTWKTSTEKNNSGFEIFRSAQNNNTWNQIGFVGGHGTTTEPKSYSFTDKDPETGSYSYKLIQIDFDGTKTESEIVNIEAGYRPEEYSLSQNYPNPFNPTTTIEYSIPENGNVKLKVFNSIGEEVATLVNDYKTAGSYKVNFNTKNLTSGLYLYKIESGNFSAVKKMILLK